ncbi:hypothetical protein CgunFtcFv8_015880 [Champsocephalus gunnari]|uniref:Uncharacterized protein n=1 Tax=Champsocephalus gunnari TaxID=52237 RepID=A0AAN8H3Q8_CHAGU|nr:hypothetical protein CgunFtcFv8_015880 [Champsocephalus gunnari]
MKECSVGSRRGASVGCQPSGSSLWISPRFMREEKMHSAPAKEVGCSNAAINLPMLRRHREKPAAALTNTINLIIEQKQMDVSTRDLNGVAQHYSTGGKLFVE